MKKILLFLIILPLFAQAQRTQTNNFIINAPKHIDDRTGKFVSGVWQPYSSVSDANASINVAYRYKGLTVLINDAGTPTEYWYQSGTSNGDLVIKNPQSGGGGSSIIAPTRAALAAVTGMAPNETAYLSEAGKQGTFRWIPSGMSAQLAADTLQGLYIKSNSSAIGAWERQVTDRTYLCSWWGLVGNGIHKGDDTLRTVIGMVPDNSTIKLPDAPITFSNQVFILKSIHLTGFGQGRSIIRYDTTQDTYPIATGYWQKRTMIVFSRSYSGASHFTIKPPRHNSQSGGTFAIGFSSELNIGTPQAGPVVGFDVEDVEIRGGSEGIVCFTATNNNVLYPAKDITITNCFFNGQNYQAMSMFAAEQYRLSNNYIVMDAATPPQWRTPFRILGGKDGKVINNSVTASISGKSFNDEAGWAVALLASTIGVDSLGLPVSPNNTNIIVEGNTFKGFNTALYAEECIDCKVINNIFANPDGDTVNSIALNLNALNIDPPGKNAIVRGLEIANNKFINYFQGFSLATNVFSIKIRNNEWVQNARKQPAGSIGFAIGSIRGAGLVEIYGNTLSGNDSFFDQGIQLVNNNLPATLRIYDNIFPRGNGSLSRNTRPLIYNYNSAGPYIETNPLGTGVMAYQTIPEGTNRRYAPDSVIKRPPSILPSQLMQGGATTGQGLVWNGTEYAAGTPAAPNTIKSGGVDITLTNVPALGNVLTGASSTTAVWQRPTVVFSASRPSGNTVAMYVDTTQVPTKVWTYGAGGKWYLQPPPVDSFVPSGGLTPAQTAAYAYFARLVTAGYSPTTTEQDAVLQMVDSLDNAGRYTSAYAIYPFLGTSAAHHAMDLKNAYNGSFVGTVTYNNNGPKFGTGTTGQGSFNTNWYVTANLSITVLTDAAPGDAATKSVAGAYDAGSSYIQWYQENNNSEVRAFNSGSFISPAGTDAAGVHTLTISGTTGITYRNGSQIGIGAGTIGGGTPPTSYPLWIAGTSSSGGLGVAYPNTWRSGFVLLAPSVDAGMAARLASWVNTYKTALGR